MAEPGAAGSARKAAAGRKPRRTSNAAGRISAVVITHNEEKRLGPCLASLQFVDEILVLDSFSTDGTQKLARSHGARVLTRRFDDFVSQKNHAIEHARGDWILSIDADEVVPPALAEELRRVAAGSPGAEAGSSATFVSSREPVAYRLPRRTFYLGRWIRHGGWYPDYNTRFFRRGRARFEGRAVHERLKVGGPVADCAHPLEHYSYASIGDHLERIHRYSTLIARDKFESGERSSVLWAVGKSIAKFFITYVYRAGFLDGRAGIVIAVLAGYYNFLKYIKLWEMGTRAAASASDSG